MDEVQRLTARGVTGIPPLVALLSEKSWVVRRAVVASLARTGTPAVAPLVGVLLGDRKNEAALAAAVDALVASGGEVEPVLFAIGDSAPPAVICDLAQILGRRKSRDAIPLLARWSAHTDDNVAVAALEALGSIGGEASVEPLLAALRTRNFFRTFPAIAVLGQSGDLRAVGPLVELLAEPHYAAEAASALGRSGQVSAVAPLARLVLEGDDDLVRTAARALADLRGRRAERFGESSVVAAAFRAAMGDADATSRLNHALIGADANDTVAVATMLGWLHSESGVVALMSLLDREPAIVEMATSALRVLGSEAEPALRAAIRTGDSLLRARLIPLLGVRRTVVEELVLCLDDPDGGVRALACGALGRIGDVKAVSAVFRLVGEPDARVDQAALAAVQSLGSDETKARALAAATSGDVRTRRSALRILAYFGYPEAIDVLLAAIHDDDERVRDAAAPGLAMSDDPRSVPALIEATRHPSFGTRAAVVRALGQAISTPAVIAALVERLGDEDAWVRYYACQALGKLQPSGIGPRIEAMLADAAGQVRVAAIEAMGRIGGDRALVVLDQASLSPDLDIRRAALTGLGRMRRPGAFAGLLRAANADDPETRLAAVLAIAQTSSPEVIGALIRAGGDPDAHVRGAAFESLSTQAGHDATRWLIDRLGIEADRSRASSALAHQVDGRIEGILTALEVADATMATWLVEVLLRMRGPNGGAAAEAVLQLDNVDARRAAARSLAQVHTAAARDALARAGEVDPDPEVRRICASAL